MFSQLSQQVLKLPNLSPPVQLVIRLIGLAVIDAVAIWLSLALASDGNWFLVGAILGTTALVNLLNLAPNFMPVRWMSPSLALIFLFALYPFIYTVYVSFTNFKDGHRFTKVEAI
jgi:arabinogalactan oligomer/maltooligosaccharide transport system permease protein